MSRTAAPPPRTTAVAPAPASTPPVPDPSEPGAEPVSGAPPGTTETWLGTGDASVSLESLVGSASDGGSLAAGVDGTGLGAVVAARGT